MCAVWKEIFGLFFVCFEYNWRVVKSTRLKKNVFITRLFKYLLIKLLWKFLKKFKNKNDALMHSWIYHYHRKQLCHPSSYANLPQLLSFLYVLCLSDPVVSCAIVWCRLSTWSPLLLLADVSIRFHRTQCDFHFM